MNWLVFCFFFPPPPPPMLGPAVLPEDWELLSSLLLIVQPLVGEIAMCWDPVFHEGSCMLGGCTCVCEHLLPMLCVCDQRAERISGTLVSAPPPALCHLPAGEPTLSPSPLFPSSFINTLAAYVSRCVSTSSSLRTGWSSMPGKRTLMAYVL